MHRRVLVVMISALAVVLAWAIPANAITHGQPDDGAHPYVGELLFFVPDEPYSPRLARRESAVELKVKRTRYGTASIDTGDWNGIASFYASLATDRYALDPAPAHHGRQGAGSVHHIAWASQDDDHLRWQSRVREAATSARLTGP